MTSSVGATRRCPGCQQQVPADAAFCPLCGLAASSAILSDTLVGATAGGEGVATSYELAPERLQAALGASYELGRLVGRGGYAEVFTVRDLRLKRELALKVLRPDLILTDALVARFRREAEAVAALEDPHIVPIYDVGEADGICWLLMPLVRGETLKTVLARELRLPVAEVRRILLEAAEALQAAHEAGVVHRDIKPENLMIEGKTGRVLLMDFGIAKAMDDSGDNALTGTGVVVGTPKYMSPEQAMGKCGPDPRSDQYSLAVVGYQMLSGYVPFEGENVREVMAKQLLEEAVPLSRIVADVPGEISATIHQALSKDPQKRFATMDAFRRSLLGERVEPTEGGRVRRPSRFHIPERRRSWLTALLWVGGLSAAVYAGTRAGLFAPAPAAPGPSTPPAAPVASSPPAAPAPAPPIGRPRGAAGRQQTARIPAPAPASAGAPLVPPATCAAAFAAEDWPVAVARCRAEQESDPAARRNLGILYALGRGVKQDERLASTYLLFAAEDHEAPDTAAILLMAKRYDEGLGIVADRAKAAGLWEVAADMGRTEAYSVIAARYELGDGRRKDPVAAAKWYEKAAEAGDSAAMTRTAENYARGRGVRRDEAKATFWYVRAAERREPEAEYQMAMMLLEGKRGFRKSPENTASGMDWLRRAAEHGHEDARKELAKRTG